MAQESATDLEHRLAQAQRELSEAREQQAATAEVLRIISSSPTELQPVLDVVVQSAARFCGADDATIFKLDGQDLCATAHWGPIPQTIGLRMPCTRGSVRGRTVLDRKTVHVLDLQAEAEEFPEGSAFAKRLGSRTTLGVPLLREGWPSGRFSFAVPKLIRLPTSRSRYSRPSPTKRRSRSRTRACSTSCGNR